MTLTDYIDHLHYLLADEAVDAPPAPQVKTVAKTATGLRVYLVDGTTFDIAVTRV